MSPKVEYDPDANAAYIRFSSEAVLDSAEISDGIVLDYDQSGHIVGMEILNARAQLPKAMLEAA